MEVLLRELQELCRQYPREEICGIIDTANTRYSIPNVATDKRFKFIFDRQEYVRVLKHIAQVGEAIKCIYHTHPFGSCEPSPADCRFILSSRIPGLIVSPTTYKWIDICQE